MKPIQRRNFHNGRTHGANVDELLNKPKPVNKPTDKDGAVDKMREVYAYICIYLYTPTNLTYEASK